MQNNILVQYQGGGYSGCFWEWNYFYIDKSGGFHDVFSSGRAGIDNAENAQALFDDDADDVYTYDMSKEEDITSFCQDCNVVHITGILQFFEDNPDFEVEFFAICSVCKRQIQDQDDITLENWHGCGGIMSTADLLICRECYAARYCECCESYVGDTEIVGVNPDEHYGHDYICSDCKEYHDD